MSLFGLKYPKIVSVRDTIYTEGSNEWRAFFYGYSDAKRLSNTLATVTTSLIISTFFIRIHGNDLALQSLALYEIAYVWSWIACDPRPRNQGTADILSGYRMPSKRIRWLTAIPRPSCAVCTLNTKVSLWNMSPSYFTKFTSTCYMTSQTIANFDMAEDIRRKVRGDFIFRLIFTLIELFYIGADAECRRNKAPHKTLMIHRKSIIICHSCHYFAFY